MSEGKVAWRRAFNDHVTQVIISHFHYLLDLCGDLVTSSCGNISDEAHSKQRVKGELEKELSVQPK